ncbi:hypothetical protein B0O99DRAFT_610901 [Bisporella sp. PMI_857]|nr:hypothetical protein B0O99DRAFT_612306 [Bisporella sp. PMI_857]KAH8600546.1 hypothetical protein B0O99DRAFT_610901 [Bisporella sp. PMI_857]
MSSTQSSQNNMVKSNSQANCLDPLDSLIDFSEYETVSYHSPSLSPSASKSQFSTRAVSNTPPVLPSSQPTFSAPSHNYELYRQTTGIPQGAVANTLAINSNNMHINNQFGFSDGYLSGMSPSDDFIDFGTAPTKFEPDVDMNFDSPAGEPAFFYPEQSTAGFVDPASVSGSNLPATAVLPTQSSNVGRLWPGMHQQQAALAKAQAQQKQQQQIIQQQRQQASGGQPRQTSQRRANNGPADPIVEEKISQLLNSMRQSSVATESDDSNNNMNMTQTQRPRKDEEDMDEDERLLASEEGKKLSSKERRQLRNKVSARAFRSRRKEYIGQLEGEIAQKVNENNNLRAQNRALMDENTRLSDLTRMLLSSPSFSGFLDNLSQNPANAQVAPAAVKQQPQQQQQQQQVRKDVNPYAAQQQMHQQHIGITMVPEQPLDFSMLDLNTDAYSYQPQVFSVLSLPEPTIDSEVLSGKSSLPPMMASEDDKVEIPVIEPSPIISAPVEEKVEVVDEEFDAKFALFASSPAPTAAAPSSEPKELDIPALLASIPSKPVQYTLVVESSVSDDEAEAAMQRVERLAASMDRMADSIRRMTVNF